MRKRLIANEWKLARSGNSLLSAGGIGAFNRSSSRKCCGAMPVSGSSMGLKRRAESALFRSARVMSLKCVYLKLRNREMQIEIGTHSAFSVELRVKNASREKQVGLFVEDGSMVSPSKSQHVARCRLQKSNVKLKDAVICPRKRKR